MTPSRTYRLCAVCYQPAHEVARHHIDRGVFRVICCRGASFGWRFSPVGWVTQDEPVEVER